MVSTDASIIQEGSEAYFRMREYGNLFSELHIVLFSKKEEREKKIKENVFIYPVFSFFKLFIPLMAFSKAKEIIKRNKEDWRVTTQDPYETGMVGFLGKIFLGVKWQAQIHTDLLSPFFFRQSIKNKIRVLLAKMIIWKADSIRVVSERIKKSLLNLGIKEEKIEVLPIAIDVSAIKNMPVTFDLKEKFPQFDFRALSVSRLTPEKNIRLAITAISKLAEEYPRMGFIIAGEGECQEDLKKEAEERGVEKNVVFTGKLSFQEAIGAMKTADIFLSSSVYEGYGVAVAEAMASNCPIVMTDTGLAGEEIRDQEEGRVVPVGSVSGMTEAIRDLLSNSEKRKEMARKADLRTSKFINREEYFKRFKDILEK